MGAKVILTQTIQRYTVELEPSVGGLRKVVLEEPAALRLAEIVRLGELELKLDRYYKQFPEDKLLTGWALVKELRIKKDGIKWVALLCPTKAGKQVAEALATAGGTA